MAQATALPTPAGSLDATAARVRGETAYDRVASLLIATVLGALLLVASLTLVYATTQAYASREAAPLELVEIRGSGGGVPEGAVGGSETINIPGAPAGEQASNNTADASEFEPAAVQAMPTAMLDAASQVGSALEDVGPSLPSGGPVAGGKRASRIGTGTPGFGFGGGDGSLGREDRWSILFHPGQTPDEYARQLDFFGIELATVNGPDSLISASRFTQPTPKVQIGSARGETRLYFAWQGAGRKTSDVELLRRAGIEVGNRPILQFVPRELESTLARLEEAYKGRKAPEIRVTRFQVVPRGGGYDFQVVDQQLVR
jgi:hypothetical protein